MYGFTSVRVRYLVSEGYDAVVVWSVDEEYVFVRGVCGWSTL